MKITEVVAALIRQGDQFMICQRPAHKARGLLWEFVGGKVEPGETKEQALIRECREELNIRLSVGDVFMDVVHEYPDITVHLTLFNATIAEGEPQKLEHRDIRWITPGEIPHYEFCPADEEILARICETRDGEKRDKGSQGENAMNHTEFRFATEQDTALILGFIRELAAYEKMTDQVVASEALLREWIFEKKKAEVIFALEDGKEVGFALFFHNFSTFLGRAGIYLEDLFVMPAYRGHGHGKGLIRELARIAVERGCGRLEWSCLDWNQPSIDFYLSLGAQQMNEWTTYRLSGDSLLAFGKREAD